MESSPGGETAEKEDEKEEVPPSPPPVPSSSCEKFEEQRKSGLLLVDINIPSTSGHDASDKPMPVVDVPVQTRDEKTKEERGLPSGLVHAKETACDLAAPPDRQAPQPLDGEETGERERERGEQWREALSNEDYLKGLPAKIRKQVKEVLKVEKDRQAKEKGKGESSGEKHSAALPLKEPPKSEETVREEKTEDNKTEDNKTEEKAKEDPKFMSEVAKEMAKEMAKEVAKERAKFRELFKEKLDELKENMHVLQSSGIQKVEEKGDVMTGGGLARGQGSIKPPAETQNQTAVVFKEKEQKKEHEKEEDSSVLLLAKRAQEDAEKAFAREYSGEEEEREKMEVDRYTEFLLSPFCSSKSNPNKGALVSKKDGKKERKPEKQSPRKTKGIAPSRLAEPKEWAKVMEAPQWKSSPAKAPTVKAEERKGKSVVRPKIFVLRKENLVPHASTSTPKKLDFGKCIERSHPKPCRICVSAPLEEEADKYKIVGRGGDGFNKLRVQIGKTKEWQDDEERKKLADSFKDRQDLKTFREAVARKQYMNLKKPDLFRLCREWGFKSNLWQLKDTIQRIPAVGGGAGPKDVMAEGAHQERGRGRSSRGRHGRKVEQLGMVAQNREDNRPYEILMQRLKKWKNKKSKNKPHKHLMSLSPDVCQALDELALYGLDLDQMVWKVGCAWKVPEYKVQQYIKERKKSQLKYFNEVCSSQESDSSSDEEHRPYCPGELCLETEGSSGFEKASLKKYLRQGKAGKVKGAWGRLTGMNLLRNSDAGCLAYALNKTFIPLYMAWLKEAVIDEQITLTRVILEVLCLLVRRGYDLYFAKDVFDRQVWRKAVEWMQSISEEIENLDNLGLKDHSHTEIRKRTEELISTVKCGEVVIRVHERYKEQNSRQVLEREMTTEVSSGEDQMDNSCEGGRELRPRKRSRNKVADRRNSEGAQHPARSNVTNQTNQTESGEEEQTDAFDEVVQESPKPSSKRPRKKGTDKKSSQRDRSKNSRGGSKSNAASRGATMSNVTNQTTESGGDKTDSDQTTSQAQRPQMPPEVQEPAAKRVNPEHIMQPKSFKKTVDPLRYTRRTKEVLTTHDLSGRKLKTKISSDTAKRMVEVEAAKRSGKGDSAFEPEQSEGEMPMQFSDDEEEEVEVVKKKSSYKRPSRRASKRSRDQYR